MIRTVLIALTLTTPFIAFGDDPWEETLHHLPDGQFAFNVYALTWQPGFFRLKNRGSRENRFYVHGIWPYFNLPDDNGAVRNYHPAYCYGSSVCKNREECQLTTVELTNIMNNQWIKALYPQSKALFQHEWQKHGSCSALDPEHYFLQAHTFEKTVFSNLKALIELTEAQNTDIKVSVATLKELLPANTGLRCATINGQSVLFEVFYFMDLKGKPYRTNTQIGEECFGQVLIPYNTPITAPDS